jgi:N-acetylmuramoyl-L-alanine amidase
MIEALEKLSADIVRRHNIPARNVVGHSDIAPGRKKDPGVHFPWKSLADKGVGLWPDVRATDQPPRFRTRELQKALAEFGYGVTETGKYDTATREALHAFRTRFDFLRLGDRPSAKDIALARALLRAGTAPAAAPAQKPPRP